jgi:hypothetical protein
MKEYFCESCRQYSNTKICEHCGKEDTQVEVW